MVKVDDLRKAVTKILKEGKVTKVIGYKKGNDGLHAIPFSIKEVGEVDHLVWDPTCVYNLSRYLVDEKRKRAKQKEPETGPVAILVKGCDSRAINVLLQEKFITRDDVHIIGVACEHSGIADSKKISERFTGKRITAVEFGGKDTFVVTANNKKTEIAAAEIMADRCLQCPANSPVIYDLLLGDKIKRTPQPTFEEVTAIEDLPVDKKWSFWTEALSTCIRCYACRSVCPMCYCEECVVDSINYGVSIDTSAQEKAQKIRWIERSPELPETAVYHMVRAIHLAGRCVDCGECQRACPVNIPLRLLNKKMEKEAGELFEYQTGFAPDQPSLVSSFRDEDPEDFIR